MSRAPRVRRAAALIIGNELLTGKIEDANVAVLAKQLFSLGIALDRVVFCRDEVDVIVDDLNTLRQRYDLVFTSGGVGPTHDDVTMQAVAATFKCSLVRSPMIETLLAGHYGERLSERHLHMANLPEDAELLVSGAASWPLVRIENIYVLPGLPQIFRQKMAGLADVLGHDVPFLSRSVATRCDEGELGDLLERLHADHPEVAIGSYPRWDDQDGINVLVTLDARSGAAVEKAMADFLHHLPADKIVHHDPPTPGKL